jgi:serine protease Do
MINLKFAEHTVFRVSTPYSLGIGFKVKGYDWIITNENLVRGNHSVVVEDLRGAIAYAKIIYIDPLLDVDILKLPFSDVEGGFQVSDQINFEKGMKIFSLGIEGNSIVPKSGTVQETVFPQERWEYIVHDAVMGYANTGGPVVDSKGLLVSMNNYGMENDSKQSTSLPMLGMNDVFEKIQGKDDMEWVRCYNCRTFLSEKVALESQSCTVCNEYVEFPKNIEPFETEGVARTIESLIEQAGFHVGFARKGANAWLIKSGSASISLNYHERSGMISGDAILCKLPNNKRKSILAYLLQENQKLDHLTFSVNEESVVLSLLLNEHSLNDDKGLENLMDLFTKADAFDNILVEQFDATWPDRI